MALSNNDILRRLRYSLYLRDPQLERIFSFSGRPLDRLTIDRYMKRDGMKVSPSESNALFRKKDHRNYKPCGDQFLRNFLTGLDWNIHVLCTALTSNAFRIALLKLITTMRTASRSAKSIFCLKAGNRRGLSIRG
jgi:hypothetical protein